eukprot:jgi/Mesvir1/12119/Mv00380-RA.1
MDKLPPGLKESGLAALKQNLPLVVSGVVLAGSAVYYVNQKSQASAGKSTTTEASRATDEKKPAARGGGFFKREVKPVEHTVKDAETLYDLVYRKYKNQGVTVAAVCKHNKIKNPKDIRPGDVIVFPVPGTES